MCKVLQIEARHNRLLTQTEKEKAQRVESTRSFPRSGESPSGEMVSPNMECKREELKV